MEIERNIGRPPARFSPSRPEDIDHNGSQQETGGAAQQDVQTAFSLDAKPLSESEQRQIEEMKHRENEVRLHEQAHRTAGGRYVRGGINYEYETGPDGKRYITGGEVSIDTSPVQGDAQATAEKMKTVRRAALAPAQPSQPDRTVAAQAQRVEAQARQEMAQENLEEAAVDAQSPGEGTGAEHTLFATEDKSGTASGLPPESVSYGQDKNATAATPRLNLLA